MPQNDRRTQEMDRGLYIAASGMLTEQLRQQQIANDLANASTPGYKADRTAQRSFGSLLLNNSLTGANVGSYSLATGADEVVTDFSPSRCATRASRWTSASPATASSPSGPTAAPATPATASSPSPPRGSSSRPRATPSSAARPADPVGNDGRVDPRQLQVTLLTNPQKAGNDLISGTPGGTGPWARSRAGALEGSGADPARSMVDMIASLRAFESGQKAIQAIDDVLGKAANAVGTLS